MTLFEPDRPILFETQRVRVRRIRPRVLRKPYLALELFFRGAFGGGSWTTMTTYGLEREADAIACAKFLETGRSFADWRDMRKAQGLPR